MRYKSAIAAAVAMLSSCSSWADYLPADTPPKIAAAIKNVEDLNDKCRGGSGDNPETMAFCDKRDAAYSAIHKQGWCYGDDSRAQVESEKQWQPCAGSKPPKYDVKAYCKSLAALGGAPSEMMYGACLNQEQSAYDGLKPSWSSTPESIRNYCDGLARLAEPGSYMMLSSCVQQETSARKSNSKAEFNY